MQLIVNGQALMVEKVRTITDLLDYLGGGYGYSAVAHNMVFVPRSNYEKTFLQEGDEIEIVSPMQGG